MTLIKRLRKERSVYDAELCDEAADHIEKLETVLKKCGQHTEACACRDLSDRGTSFPRHDWPCDCGLRVALENDE
jgi:hypothetical protein